MSRETERKYAFRRHSPDDIAGYLMKAVNFLDALISGSDTDEEPSNLESDDTATQVFCRHCGTASLGKGDENFCRQCGNPFAEKAIIENVDGPEVHLREEEIIMVRKTRKIAEQTECGEKLIIRRRQMWNHTDNEVQVDEEQPRP